MWSVVPVLSPRKARDIALSAAALLLPAGAVVGTALALLKPAPDKTSIRFKLTTSVNTTISPFGSGRCGADAPVGTDALEGSCPDDLRRQLGAVPQFAERFAAAFVQPDISNSDTGVVASSGLQRRGAPQYGGNGHKSDGVRPAASGAVWPEQADPNGQRPGDLTRLSRVGTIMSPAPPPDDPVPPVPLPPVPPPVDPAPEPLPSPWAPSADHERSMDKVSIKVTDNICALHGGWRVETGRSWHCKFPRR
jgi:hypothetical protein